MYRDLTMKDVSEQQIGQTLQVAGWVENIRDHGGVFPPLRHAVFPLIRREPQVAVHHETGLQRKERHRSFPFWR